MRFERFEEKEAWHLGSRLREIAQARKMPVAIEIRRFGQPLFYCALAGSVPDNAEWVRRKGNVVARFHRSSYHVGLELQQTQSSLEEKFGLATGDYAAHGGAFPLIVSGAGVIGSVTVSGLPQRLDHALVVEALAQELGRDGGQLQLPVKS